MGNSPSRSFPSPPCPSLISFAGMPGLPKARLHLPPVCRKNTPRQFSAPKGQKQQTHPSEKQFQLSPGICSVSPALTSLLGIRVEIWGYHRNQSAAFSCFEGFNSSWQVGQEDMGRAFPTGERRKNEFILPKEKEKK